MIFLFPLHAWKKSMISLPWLVIETRKQRKVLLVEQPGQKQVERSSHVARSVNTSQARPLSADDIPKAKMRAQFMQSKHGKSSASSED